MKLRRLIKFSLVTIGVTSIALSGLSWLNINIADIHFAGFKYRIFLRSGALVFLEHNSDVLIDTRINWIILLVFGIATLGIAYRLPKQPIAAGLCPHCGYDLRATPERCPECGKSPGESL